MKNFILVEAPLTREARYLLLLLEPGLPDEAREFSPFTHYSSWLEQRGYAENTVLVYSEHVARFIDYVYEASKTPFPAELDVTISSVVLSYQAFLLFGKGATNPIARELAERLNKEKLTSQSSLAQNIEASIRWFLLVSEERNKISPDPLFGAFYTGRSEYRSQFEISAHKANSWLAAVIRDSLKSVLPKQKNQPLFPRAKRRDRKNDKKAFKKEAFPIESSVNLIRQAKPPRAIAFYRDMAIYALLAASGARTSEVLQLRMEDIHIKGDLSVYLRDPFSRDIAGITEEEHKLLSWKGRATELTYLIEPFASIFRDHLEQYLRYEYNASVNHNFLFQDLNGRPYFASDRSSRDKTFKKYALKVGIGGSPKTSLHSLRHMYGTYVLNYMPVPGQKLPGMPISYVKILMGHSTLTSTMKYAKHDTDIIEAYLQHANQYVLKRGEASVETIREEFHMRQLAILREEAKRIEGSNHD